MLPVEIDSKPGSGGSENFLKFLTNELQPYIKDNYPGNEKSILYGASNSGLFTIYSMLEKPDAFFAYLTSSPMIGHCKGFMTDLLNIFQQPDKLKGKYLFMHWGTEDHEKVTVDLPPFIEMMSEKLTGLKIRAVSLEDEGHVPAGGVSDGLQFVYKQAGH